MVEIIGLLGHQGVGKNYLAEKILPKILPQKNTVVLAFADHFKIECISKFGANYDKVFGKKDFDTRKLLQRVGSEEGRDKYGADIWIKHLHNWIKVLSSRGVERFIISDVRFENEAKCPFLCVNSLKIKEKRRVFLCMFQSKMKSKCQFFFAIIT